MEHRATRIPEEKPAERTTEGRKPYRKPEVTRHSSWEITTGFSQKSGPV